ncbi:MAG: DinB family protein [Spirosomataceae bacterium]
MKQNAIFSPKKTQKKLCTYPKKTEYPQNNYFSRYIEGVEYENVIIALTEQKKKVQNLYNHLTEEQSLFRYEPVKWSLKQILGHLIDTERIFSYRALCIARGEKNELPGFDENAYMVASNFDSIPLVTLLLHYESVRLSTFALIDSFSDAQDAHLEQVGIANGNKVSARALIWMIAGHEAHHLRVINERYSAMIL